MKQGRSNQFTTGLCNTLEGTTLKTLFFELDKYDPISNTTVSPREYIEQIVLVKNVYEKYHLDYVRHRTKNGMHFLSPTLLQKEEWKLIITELRHLNTKCPMNTLRVEPNKYPEEPEFWYTSDYIHHDDNKYRNSNNMVYYLNRLFGSRFAGNPEMDFDVKIVRYPLPEMR